MKHTCNTVLVVCNHASESMLEGHFHLLESTSTNKHVILFGL